MTTTETLQERVRRLQAAHAARICVARIPTRFNKSTLPQRRAETARMFDLDHCTTNPGDSK